MTNFFQRMAASLVLAGTAFLAPPAIAASGVNVGSLNCTVEGGFGLLLGSSKKMKCVFDPAGEGRKHRYEGRIGKLGLDIGVTGKSYMTWLVFAPGSIKPGALAGTYAGASAEASVGLGLGANVLVGGSNKSIALQPVSVEGQTGLNLAAGLSSIELETAE
jgi:hypothetical protein